MMNERTLKVLEFPKIIELLKGEASTGVGKSLAAEATPKTSLADVQILQDETDEAMHVLRLNKTVPFSHIADITEHTKRSEIGSVLDIQACLEVMQVLYCGRNVINFIESMEENADLLQAMTEELVPLRHLEDEITSKFDDYGEIVDDASQALRSVRQSIRSHEASIRERLQQFTKSKSAMLSDTIVTIRNNRYVLPVKHEYRSAIGGIVHDESSSGQTLFIEPRPIIELNNQIQQARVKEKQEIEKVLEKLTMEIGAHAEQLRINLRVLASVDFIFARARLAEKMKAAKPILNDKGIINMQQARHPLIDKDVVVANDVELGTDFHAIVITGPNTGGKTVTLKMIGLCVVMTQTGLQIPALDGCQIAVFDHVFADIGDEQSIEQNLSTFSSHMTNIVDIMDQVTSDSLVLFDELGAGTDPQEGAALAMALLDKVIENEARVVATTHYPELKAYGYNRDSVMNASVEFDVETLRPTYRLLMGVPGRSNAFEISSRLGLHENIIQHAKEYVGMDSKKVENMIAALEDSKKAAEQELEETEAVLKESESIRLALEKEWEEFQTKRDNLYKKAEEKAEKALSKAREEAKIIVDEVRHMRDKTNWKEHEWIEAQKMLDEAQPDLVPKKKVKENKETGELEVGDEIKHRTIQQPGHIIEKKNKDEYIIQVGMMKLTAKRKDLTFIRKSNDKEEVESVVTHMVKTSSNQAVKTELDLRGKRYEEAIGDLEKYIDEAIMQGHARVTIIHGKGTGALRKGVEQFIRTHPQIKSSRLGAQNEGGSGVTIVEF